MELEIGKGIGNWKWSSKHGNDRQSICASYSLVFSLTRVATDYISPSSYRAIFIAGLTKVYSSVESTILTHW